MDNSTHDVAVNIPDDDRERVSVWVCFFFVAFPADLIPICRATSVPTDSTPTTAHTLPFVTWGDSFGPAGKGGSVKKS